jgi:phosphoglycerol transferase MdoB-like AlkP superfamily enzyme
MAFGLFGMNRFFSISKSIGKKQPFMSTLFSASSHDPFKVPEKVSEQIQTGSVTDSHSDPIYRLFSEKIL